MNTEGTNHFWGSHPWIFIHVSPPTLKWPLGKSKLVESRTNPSRYGSFCIEIWLICKCLITVITIFLCSMTHFFLYCILFLFVYIYLFLYSYIICLVWFGLMIYQQFNAKSIFKHINSSILNNSVHNTYSFCLYTVKCQNNSISNVSIQHRYTI